MYFRLIVVNQAPARLHRLTVGVLALIQSTIPV